MFREYNDMECNCRNGHLFLDGPTGFIAITQNITIGTAGTYTVTIFDGSQYNNCSRTLTVNPRPTPTVADQLVHAGDLGIVYTTETGMLGYSWSITGGTINLGDGTFSVNVTWNTLGTQNISVSYGPPSCRGSSSAYSVLVNANPAAPAAGNNSRCGTGTVTISATPFCG